MILWGRVPDFSSVQVANRNVSEISDQVRCGNPRTRVPHNPILFAYIHTSIYLFTTLAPYMNKILGFITFSSLLTVLGLIFDY